MDIPFSHHEIQIRQHTLHTVTAGDSNSPSIVFLHGWPEDWSEWTQVMHRAATTHRVIAFDLPGVGRSRGLVPGGTKAAIAEVLHDAIQTLGLKRYALVGQDVGAMVTYSYLRKFPGELSAAVLMDSVSPGIEPWTKVLSNPHIWHFAFHNTKLPEIMVRGRERPYFDYFYDVLTRNHAAIGEEARTRYVAAYGTPEALQAGFDWYRGFDEDAKSNASDTSEIAVPVLYVRGEFEGGNLDEYAAGLRKAGLRALKTARIPGSGHFAPEENADRVWAELKNFMAR